MSKHNLWILALIFFLGCKDDEPQAPPPNLVSQIIGEDFTSTFRYNGLNKLIEKVTEGNLLEEETYVYDGLGRLRNVTTTFFDNDEQVSQLACGFEWDDDQVSSQQCLSLPNNIRFTTEYEWSSDRTNIIETVLGGSTVTTYTLVDGNVTIASTVNDAGPFPSQTTIEYEYDNSPTFDVDVFGPNNFLSSQINAHPSAIHSTEVLDINTDLRVTTEVYLTYDFGLDEEGRVIDITEARLERRIENSEAVSEEESSSSMEIRYRP